MADSVWATVIAAVVALTGTLVGLAVGYHRWSRERTAQRFARFETDRQDIYKTLWDRVEEINAALRRERIDDAGFSGMVTDLNEFIIRNSAHVDDSDYRLANEYVAAVKAFHRVVSALEPDVKIPYGQTMTIPPELVKRVRELATAQEHVNRVRDALRGKVRLVLGGTTA